MALAPGVAQNRNHRFKTGRYRQVAAFADDVLEARLFQTAAILQAAFGDAVSKDVQRAAIEVECLLPDAAVSGLQ